MVRRLQFIAEALRVGVVTRRYPYEQPEVAEGYRGRPELDASRCIGCTACGNVCTPSAITFVDDPARGVRRLEFYLGRCVFCGRCAEVCPASAITITRDFELASLNDEDLRLVIEIRLARCQSCGRHFMPSRHLKTVARKLGEAGPDAVALCPECRRVSEAVALARVGALR